MREQIRARALATVVLCTVVLSALVLMSMPFAHAQPVTNNVTSGLPGGLQYCSAYFAQNSLLGYFAGTRSDGLEAGDETGSPVIIKNTNDAPVTNVDVYVLVFRDTYEGSALREPSSDLYAIVPVEEDLTFMGGEERTLNFTWSVPQGTIPGPYHASLYIRAHDRFDMFGQSLTSDDQSTRFDMSVIGSTPRALSFERDSVRINDTLYTLGTAPYDLSMSENQAEIAVSVSNKTTNQVAEGKVTWMLYGGDEATPGALLKTWEDPITLVPGTRTILRHSLTGTELMNHLSYLLLGTLETNADEPTAIMIRLAQEVPFERAAYEAFAYLGATTYPTAKDSEAFVCFDPGVFQDLEAPRVVLEATVGGDSFLAPKKVVGESTYTHTGAYFPNALVALAVPLDGKQGTLSLTASLYDGETLIDTATVAYSCTALGVPCGMGGMFQVLLSLLLVLAVLGVIIYMYRKQHRATEESITTETI